MTAKVAIRGTSDKVVGGVQGTMDRITHEIRQSLEERQTLVMWMFDASGSLKDRRNAITERFENIYRQLNDGGPTDGLYTAVVSYGEKTELITDDPVKDIGSIIQPIRHMKVDESGVENVFTAVRLAVDKWKQFKRADGKWNKVMFIVTDERGDDAESQLEEVISLCKRNGVRVYVVATRRFSVRSSATSAGSIRMASKKTLKSIRDPSRPSRKACSFPTGEVATGALDGFPPATALMR